MLIKRQAIKRGIYEKQRDNTEKSRKIAGM